MVRKHIKNLRNCSSCGSPSHLTARAPDCPFHVQSDGAVTATRANDRDVRELLRVMAQQGDEEFQQATRNSNVRQNCDFLRMFMPSHEKYTRSRSFHTMVKPAYCEILSNCINNASDRICDILLRTQLFLSDFTLNNPFRTNFGRGTHPI
ncbi:hypothetical protein DM01DRAFT_361696 [Hesseltinella vesiculosa]|uniref:Uncharacterized protein n=1 Tax=Hesseltinella vesiculosa TaxID=101127 RepID=A0A1X2GRR9_9FUNG|nr:hypothetical protein DM01DRAFT_361696 [Hesseltinella vesiculosa]